ncbi:MAG: four helix bundle protein [Bacteroidota bacterium]
MRINNYKELIVWQKAVELTVLIYSVVNNFPKEEKFGLISQVTRSSVSIPSNIAEGAGRGSKKEFSQFLSIAMGSCFEMETQLIIANKLGWIDEEKFQDLINRKDEIQKMIFGLKQSLEN